VTSGQIAGIVLVLMGCLDLVVGFALVGPRMPNPRARHILQLAMVIGALTLVGLGVAFLTGILGTQPAPA